MANENRSPFPRESAGPSSGVPLEIAHILFIDMVAFSKLRPQQQAAVQNWLTDAVPKLPEVVHAKANGRVIFRSTGDGMFVAFFRDLLSPVRAAIQLDRLLKTKGKALGAEIGASIHFRMGINTGPVYIVRNVNGEDDLAGDGVVKAARIMDCGDADHILLSADVAYALRRLDAWRPMVHEAGRALVKGEGFDVCNLQGQFPDNPAFGNQLTPRKVTDTRVEIRRHVVETTDNLDALDREERIRSYLRVGGMVAGALVAVGIISFVTYRLDPTGKNFTAMADGFQKTLRSPASATPGREPVADVPDSPSPAPTPTTVVTRTVTRYRDAGVPDVTTIPLSDAKQMAHDYGFAIDGKIEKEYSDEFTTPGTVIRQSLIRARTLHVVVSRGAPPPPPDPNPPPDETMNPEPPKPQPPPPPAPAYTGVLVDAHGKLKRREDMDALRTSGGEELFSFTTDPESAGFYASREAAKSKRCGSNPLILSDVQFKGGMLTLSENDSRRWDEAGSEIKGNIAIVYGE